LQQPISGFGGHRVLFISQSDVVMLQRQWRGKA
jgi:hypothetical protein